MRGTPLTLLWTIPPVLKIHPLIRILDGFHNLLLELCFEYFFPASSVPNRLTIFLCSLCFLPNQKLETSLRPSHIVSPKVLLQKRDSDQTTWQLLSVLTARPSLILCEELLFYDSVVMCYRLLCLQYNILP